MTQKRGSETADDMKMEVVKEGDRYVACGLYKAREDTPPGGDGTSEEGSEPTEDDGPATDGSIPNPIPKTS
jgi:hypothetical protein